MTHVHVTRTETCHSALAVPNVQLAPRTPIPEAILARGIFRNGEAELRHRLTDFGRVNTLGTLHCRLIRREGRRKPIKIRELTGRYVCEEIGSIRWLSFGEMPICIGSLPVPIPFGHYSCSPSLRKRTDDDEVYQQVRPAGGSTLVK